LGTVRLGAASDGQGRADRDREPQKDEVGAHEEEPRSYHAGAAVDSRRVPQPDLGLFATLSAQQA
jgi:hypothetical protein